VDWRTIFGYVEIKYISFPLLTFIELYNRTGDKEAAKVQTFKNTNFMEAVARVEARG